MVIRSWLGVILVDKRGRLQRRVDGVVLIVCSLERKSADIVERELALEEE